MWIAMETIEYIYIYVYDAWEDEHKTHVPSTKPSIRATTRIVALVTLPTGPDCHYGSVK